MFWTSEEHLAGMTSPHGWSRSEGCAGHQTLGSRGRRVPLEDGRRRDLVREASELFGAAGEVDQHIVDTG